MGGYGANLRRICLTLHAHGQVASARLTTLLNDIGPDISKRQMVRLLTNDLDGFVAEDRAVLHAGLVSSRYVTVDDTGARHSHNPCYAPPTSAARILLSFGPPNRSLRLNFTSLLRGGYQDYVLDDAAFDYLKERGADAAMTAGLHALEPQHFCNQVPFMAHPADKGIDIFDRQQIGIHAEAGLWGSIRHHGYWATPSSCPTTPASSGSAIARCAGFMPNGSYKS